MVAITAEDSFYILRFDREAYDAALASGTDVGDEGVEEAFEVIAEVSEKYISHERSNYSILPDKLPLESRLASGLGTASYIQTVLTD